MHDADLACAGERAGSVGGGRAVAEAELAPAGRRAGARGGRAAGTRGPLAYRQGKPMRPDVARAFDRMAAAARADGVALIVDSRVSLRRRAGRALRAPPRPEVGRAAGQVAAPARHGARPRPAVGVRMARAQRAALPFRPALRWEPWHYGFTLNPRSTPVDFGARAPGDGRSAVPAFVPARYRAADRARGKALERRRRAARGPAVRGVAGSTRSRVSPAGARGIAQFMPGTARAYGLRDPFDAGAAITRRRT